jgi:P27 family predicted phage terminase small subunit
MGRKPLPREIKKLRGTLQPCRDRAPSTFGDAVPVEEITRRCRVSGLDAATRRARYIYWREVKKLAELGIMTPAYCAQILIYAIEMDHFIDLTHDIKKNGVIITCTNGDGVEIKVPNPAVKMRAKSEETLIKIGSNFGFSPVDRQRLKMEAAEEKPTGIKALFATIITEGDTPDEQ